MEGPWSTIIQYDLYKRSLSLRLDFRIFLVDTDYYTVGLQWRTRQQQASQQSWRCKRVSDTCTASTASRLVTSPSSKKDFSPRLYVLDTIYSVPAYRHVRDKTYMLKDEISTFQLQKEICSLASYLNTQSFFQMLWFSKLKCTLVPTILTT